MINLWSDALWFPIGMLLFCVLLWIRNAQIYGVRIDFIFGTPAQRKAYDNLPKYGAMIWNPKFWLLWTTYQWSKYMGVL